MYTQDWDNYGGLMVAVGLNWRYTIAGLDRWNGPVDWNGGLAEIVLRGHASVQTYAILPAMT